MLALNQLNGVNSNVVIMGRTVLTCSVTGKQFIADRDGCSVNYAHDNAGAILSDEGVIVAITQSIQRREVQVLYINNVGHGAIVADWKGARMGRVVSATSWARYSRLHGYYSMFAVTVRMFDGSLWTGRMSSLYECITLRYKEN